ncbi:MAG: flagellar assembly protein FliW [Myxococcales bacterium FL481]|nr:MAG: flagellar assembly protein FliW [Myxococcales bacterium FL481]
MTMPLGIPGFVQAQEFFLLDHRPGSMFRWLQCVNLPELAFVVVDPLTAIPDYPVDLVRRSVNFLDLDPDEDMIVLAICTVPPAPEPPTLNLLAPIGIGLTSRRGAQVVLHETGFGPREEFLPPRP